MDTKISSFNDYIRKCHEMLLQRRHVRSSHSVVEKIPREPLLEVAVAPSMGLGTYATSDISPEQPYMLMPMECIMSVQNLLSEANGGDGGSYNGHKQDSTFARVIGEELGFSQMSAGGQQQQRRRPDDFHAILLYLLRERHKGAASKFAPYIDILPTQFDTPYYWSDWELEAYLSEASYMLEAVKQERASIRSKYQSLSRNLLSKYPNVFSPPEAYSFELYEWASNILNSRTIWVRNYGGVRALVPLLDAINCREMPENPNRLHSSERDATLDAVLTKSPSSFAKGEQVFENYGSDNFQNFFSHGFTLKPNSHDCVKVKIAYEGSDAEVIRAFQSKQVPVKSVHCLRKGKSIPPRAMEALRILASNSGKSSPLSMLREIISQKLNSYPSTLAEDRQQLAARHVLKWKKQLALEFIISEKELLLDLLRDLEQFVPAFERQTQVRGVHDEL